MGKVRQKRAVGSAWNLTQTLDKLWESVRTEGGRTRKMLAADSSRKLLHLTGIIEDWLPMYDAQDGAKVNNEFRPAYDLRDE